MKKQIGTIGVDAGLCWIGDPCYVLHADPKPEDIGKDWIEFCDKMGDLYTRFKTDSGRDGLGICVSTGYGDGEYPVYAEIVNGQVKSVTVKFF